MFNKNQFGKFQCPCCLYFTLDEGLEYSFEICPVCFWEVDGAHTSGPDYIGGANKISITQARINFKIYGACDALMAAHTRLPFEDEL